MIWGNQYGDKNIIQSLVKKKMIHNDFKYNRISDGTSSEIWIIESNKNRKIIVKGNTQSVIKYESYFLKEYSLFDVFPKLISIDEKFNYLIYEYIEGSCHDINLDVCLLNNLKNIIKNYHLLKNEGYGWLDELSKWDDFLF